jgi:hypothetical protein
VPARLGGAKSQADQEENYGHENRKQRQECGSKQYKEDSNGCQVQRSRKIEACIEQIKPAGEGAENSYSRSDCADSAGARQGWSIRKPAEREVGCFDGRSSKEISNGARVKSFGKTRCQDFATTGAGFNYSWDRAASAAGESDRPVDGFVDAGGAAPVIFPECFLNLS